MARTEGDTWDLASSVGATATGVAASRALASKQPNPLINDPFADALVKAVGVDYCNRMADGELEFGDEDPLFNRERICEQIAVRTRFFDDFFAGAVSAGIRQAVILASGLDTRAYRLPWPPDAVVFEIDQPQVIEFKSGVLEGLGAAAAADHRTVAIDLRDDWLTALRDNGFDATRPTAWIAEGLLPYLPPDAQDRLFDNVTTLSAPGSRLATEHMDIQGSPEEWAEKLTERSRRMGSNLDLTQLFYWGERNSAGDYLTSKGWDVTIRPTREAYAANGFELPEHELTALEGDSGYLSATLK
ncbi:class I SAM-dependent methyltransferase [Mycolicibacterium moriokaense]|uniref:S-adenosyl-L-methionine-dependent methyltransferase n=1 Tax=Mycolicibacterium moriokaense TaxID=39691 RepID=A0A318HIJ9_9MYCO|nr:class I SAM-dependent methyltransferase [Mycolicibacterium moriokaense]PXX05384.1 methyltransferase (TIGR00027 family) [Mycolicibacterium moriokaense]